jgi:hypothetical protein
MKCRVQKKRPDAGNGGRAFAFAQPQWRKPMSDKLQRLLEQAKTKRRKRPGTILIDCPRPEDMPARVDVLIAAGNLTEAERPHCMFWPNSDPDHWDGTRYEWALMQAKNMTPEDVQRLLDKWMLKHEETTREEAQRLWNATIADARATVLAAANSGDDGSSKKRKGRFPVNRL